MRRIIAGFSLLLSLSPAVHAADIPPDRTALVRGNTQFALDLYAKLRTEDGNLFLSPYSISSALSMTYGGARGQTAAEMAKVLHFELANDKLHPAFGSLMREVNGEADKKRGYQLSTANALWGQKGYPFLDNFLKLNAAGYGALLREVDFGRDTDQARKTINAWVEKETQDKIKELFKPGSLSSDSRLVLTNAIYFKGDWANQFKKDRTREAPFYLGGGKQTDVPLMHQTAPFRYFDGNTFQALELPYVGNHLAMVVLLPKKIDGLAALEKELSPDKLEKWLGGLHKDEVEVQLPRFTMTAEFPLEKTLPAMGMPTAFSDAADFSGIAKIEQLSIGVVRHKAFVDVNEGGTEAAAATGVEIRAVSDTINPVFRADHPFLFLIRDAQFGVDPVHGPAC